MNEYNFENCEFDLLQPREVWGEKLEIVAGIIVNIIFPRTTENTNIWICFGAFGIFGAFSVFDGPARRVSLK